MRFEGQVLRGRRVAARCRKGTVVVVPPAQCARSSVRAARSDGDERPIGLAGGRAVDRRRWTVRHEVAQAKLLQML